jgi:hypothetical protein
MDLKNTVQVRLCFWHRFSLPNDDYATKIKSVGPLFALHSNNNVNRTQIDTASEYVF